MSPVSRPLEPGAQVARLFLVHGSSLYAHLKHLGVRNNGTYRISINAQREFVNFRFICDTRQATTRKQVSGQVNKFLRPLLVPTLFVHRAPVNAQFSC